MVRGAVLDDRTESLQASSADIVCGCQKLQDEVRQLFEQKLGNASARLNCSVKALIGREFHLEPLQVNALIGITSFALGALAAKETRTMGALEKLSCLDKKSALPTLTLVDATSDTRSTHLQILARQLDQPLQAASSLNNFHKIAHFSTLREENSLDSAETIYSHGISTIENWRGQKWLHQDEYARVPMHKDGASWWHDPDQNLTWVKTSHYLESRSNGGSFFRTYKNGGIQIRFSDGYEFYESSFPERRKIVLSTGKTDCRAQQQGILSAEDSDLENSLKKTGR